MCVGGIAIGLGMDWGGGGGGKVVLPVVPLVMVVVVGSGVPGNVVRSAWGI